MLIRAKFSKLKPVRYISHLELMDTFRKIFRRAELPVAYSGGYNPQIKFSMGQPLSVGMTGESEYFDLNLNKKIDRVLFLNRVNEVSPRGINVLEAKYIPEESKSLQALINCAVYNIRLSYQEKNVNKRKLMDIIEEFMQKEEIIITRYRRKKENRKIDIKPLLYGIELIETDLWSFTVSTGSRGNIRAEELVRALGKYYSIIKKEVPVINITRKFLYVKINNKFYPPLAEEIVGR
ncbi:MAG: TIGR03936 family radical SAM-associated protein [Bacillota bacterium]